MDEGLVVEVMDEDECRARLASGTFGRVAVVTGGEPRIFPVNYRFAEDSVVFVTGEGTKLDASDLGPVSFEIDGTDGEGGGWSVVVQGTGYEITSARDHRSELLRHLPLGAGARSPGHPVRIPVREISGRRVRPSGSPAGAPLRTVQGD